MTKLHVTLTGLIAVMIVSSIAAENAVTYRQTKTREQQLIGTWILVSLNNVREDGSRFSPVGSNPKDPYTGRPTDQCKT